LPPNFNGDAYRFVTSFSFSDGINTYSSGDPNTRVIKMLWGMDSYGSPVMWSFELQKWLTGSNPHVDGDRIATVKITGPFTTFGDNALHNLICSAIDNTGDTPNACGAVTAVVNQYSNANTSSTLRPAGGTWMAPYFPVPTLSQWALTLLSITIGASALGLRIGYQRTGAMD
jgi:hypothetical protein